GDGHGDTWEWNGNTWRMISPGGPSDPPPRGDGHMVFDDAAGVCLLFGGEGTSGIFSDTWTWDGVVWTQLSASGPTPARSQFALAYDRARDRSVLFGGNNCNGCFLNDTWEWDGVEWSQVGTGGLEPRASCEATYDNARQDVALFGGYDGNFLNDVWDW